MGDRSYKMAIAGDLKGRLQVAAALQKRKIHDWVSHILRECCDQVMLQHGLSVYPTGTPVNEGDRAPTSDDQTPHESASPDDS